MKVVKFLIERPRIFFLTLSFIILSGVSSVLSIPIQENPELAQRWSSIEVRYPGSSALKIETEIINELEVKVREVVEIAEIDSVISQGFSNTLIELEQSVPPELIEQTWSKIQDKLDQISTPSDASIVLRRSSGPPITLQYALSWRGDGEIPLIMLSRLGDQLKRKLSSIGSTHKVEVIGGADEEILIEVDASKISNLGITYAELSSVLRLLDKNTPIGVAINDDSEYPIRVKNNLNDIESISQTPIAVRDNQVIRLFEIADISKKPVSPVEDISFYNGKRVIYVSLTGTFQQRIYDYVERAKNIVDEFKLTLPEEISIEEIYDESSYTEKKFNELIKSFSLAFFFVLLLSLFFLGIKSALIVTVILPFSVSLVFLGCRIIDLPLHMTSITGIIIALGLLIDNGIIIVEDYRYRRSKGYDSIKSIEETLKQLTIPLLAATATTVFSFMPIVTGEGSSIEFVGGLAKTVIMSISSSLILALTVVPTLLNYLDSTKFKDFRLSFLNSGFSSYKLLEKYRSFLIWAFFDTKRAILVAILFPLIGFILFNFISKDFFPPQDRDMFKVVVEMPQNTSAVKTYERVQLIREQIINSKIIDINKDYWFIGRKMPRVLMNVVGGGKKEGNNNVAEGVFFAKDYYQMMERMPLLSKYIKESNPDVIILIENFFSGPPVFADISFRILGDDTEILRVLGNRLELIIKNAPNVVLTKSDLSQFSTNIELDIKDVNSVLFFKDPNLVTNQLFIANNGIILGTLLDGTKEIPIRMKSNIPERDIIGSTLSLSIPSLDGIESINSYSQANITRKSTNINKFQGQKMNTIQGWIVPTYLPSDTEEFVSNQIQSFKDELPIGYSLMQTGEAEARGQSQSQIYSSAAIYLILITLGLVFALNSFRQTALILSVAFFCIGLSFLGLFIGQQNYGFIGTISAVGLIGLSINDSIVVLSHLKEKTTVKKSRNEIVEVVIRSTRHIVTTSATTLGGFLPLIFSSVFFQPLAWAMSIGVLGATLIALLYIPAMYINMEKIRN